MNPVALPIIGEISLPEGALYAFIAAVLITVLLYTLWKSLGKGALVALILLGVLVVFIMSGR